MAENVIDRENILNINVGILGHVDSGKTSLVKTLSTMLSTAALDKNPQSQKRGITLDLGFSAFTLPMPSHLTKETEGNYDSIQFTLVDCPGHASLIKTIIGGAQIIDMILLVIDANKGIQTQTAECIVIGEITTDDMIIVMNKIDMIPEDEREAKITKMTKRLKKIFSTTKFAEAPIIPVSAAVGGEKVAAVSTTNTGKGGKSAPASSFGIDTLISLINDTVKIPKRNDDAPLYYAIDHCFSIKGHGTVLTGTVLNGSVSINSTLEIPQLQIQRKVKSMQMFRKPVRRARQGDRVGLCVTNLDPKLIERGVAAAPGSVPALQNVVCLVKNIRFYKFPCRSSAKYHISIGHNTVLANVLFFGANDLNDNTTSSSKTTNSSPEESEKWSIGDKGGKGDSGEMMVSDATELLEASGFFNDSKEITIDDENPSTLQTKTQTISTASANSSFTTTETQLEDSNALSGKSPQNPKPTEITHLAALNGSYHKSFPSIPFSWERDWEAQEELRKSESFVYGDEPLQWALLRFPFPVYCPLGSLVIGSRLDTDTREGGSAAQQCRLAFYGPVKGEVPAAALTVDSQNPLRVFSWKEKEGEVFRLEDVKNMKNVSTGDIVPCCKELIAVKLARGSAAAVQPLIGLKVYTEAGQVGTVVAAFGAEGKCRVKFERYLPNIKVGTKLFLKFKNYAFNKTKRFNQSDLQLEDKSLEGLKDLEEVDITEELQNPNPTLKPKNPINSSVWVKPKPVKYDENSLILKDKKEKVAKKSEKFENLQIPVNESNISEKEETNDEPPINNNIKPTIKKPVNSLFPDMKKSETPETLLNSIEPEETLGTKTKVDDMQTITTPKGVQIKVSPSIITKLTSTSSSTPTIIQQPPVGTIQQTGWRMGLIESLKGSEVKDSGGSVLGWDTAIVSGAFRIEENIRLFVGVEVIGSNGEKGQLLGPFGKLGKCKVNFPLGCRSAVGSTVKVLC